MKIFGIEIKRVGEDEEEENKKSFVAPEKDDGAVVITAGPNANFGAHTIDFDAAVKNEIELITKYREMALQPELEQAIDDIVNEAIIIEDGSYPVELNMDEVDLSENIKKRIKEEFDDILKMMNFKKIGHEIFRRWYVDGRLNYHLVIDNNRIKDGVLELRYIDPRRLRKIREMVKEKDPETSIEIVKIVKEYYLYNEKGVLGTDVTGTQTIGTHIAVDSIASVTSGLLDPRRAMVLSYLHKAIKPLNLLRNIEDAAVIYRLVRAPERRVFYVDTGDLPNLKAEQYLKNQMIKHRNKIVYDAASGEIRDDRKFMSIQEDFWIPRREGSTATQIDTLQGGNSQSSIDEIEYFQKKLYKSLNIPTSRIEEGTGFSLGRTTEITRDEVKFNKFIRKIRNRFSIVFDEILEKQCVLKGICTSTEFQDIKEDYWYDFLQDNAFTEMKNKEIHRERLALLMDIDQFVGRYYSMEWVNKNILEFDDEELKDILKQIEKESDDALAGDDVRDASEPVVDPEPNDQPDDNFGGQYRNDKTVPVEKEKPKEKENVS